MQTNSNDQSLETLREIRNIMDRSARFLSLAGWAGIWAGLVGLAGTAIAFIWLQKPAYSDFGKVSEASLGHFDSDTMRFIYLALLQFVVAMSGVIYFSAKKAKKEGYKLWNNASRQMLIALFFPLFAGGIFAMIFIYYGCGFFVVPTCLTFYGLALVSASRHTLSDIRYMGMFDVTLGCTNLFFPGFGLVFWALGFGVLNILYGVIMWNKYDRVNEPDKAVK